MVVRNGCMNPASVQHDPGGKLRPAWPADSTVTARFSACQHYGQPPAPLRQRGQAVEALLAHHPDLCHLRLAKDGTPVHPRYLPQTLLPQAHQVRAHV